MTSPHIALLLPLISALLYVVGALLLRRAADFGVGFWRTTFVANLICAAVFSLLLGFGGTFHLSLLWQPATLAVLFMAGSILNFISLDRGDVSLATPVLGIKIILVAVGTTLLLGETLGPRLWAAAGLSTFAIALLNWTRGVHHHHVTLTILAAGASATSFALFDVLVQKWAPAWGAGRFVPTMLGFGAMLSLGTIWFFPAPLTAIPSAAWPWLVCGSVILAFQSLMFVWSVATFGQATSVNVVYSSRGLWSVVLVWIIDHWFGNRERELGGAVLRWRLAGALMMMAAIALVLLPKADS